mmetsp:Transcript_2270/g.4422  ORF Transcript_2270/g.4422 Transcript_2270/m.4422 type:complete len:211 (+) Transcript_2270:1678-2310(+)
MEQLDGLLGLPNSQTGLEHGCLDAPAQETSSLGLLPDLLHGRQVVAVHAGFDHGDVEGRLLWGQALEVRQRRGELLLAGQPLDGGHLICELGGSVIPLFGGSVVALGKKACTARGVLLLGAPLSLPLHPEHFRGFLCLRLLGEAAPAEDQCMGQEGHKEDEELDTSCAQEFIQGLHERHHEEQAEKCGLVVNGNRMSVCSAGGRVSDGVL